MSLQRQDPMDEFPQVVPVTVRNAALLLREAHKAMVDAELDVAAQALELAKAKRALEDKVYLHKAALHRLNISGMQPNGGEE